MRANYAAAGIPIVVAMGMIVSAGALHAQANPAHPARQCSRHLDVGWECKDEDGQHRPEQRGSRQDRPAGDEQDEERNGKQASPQIVEDLPAGQHGQRIRDRPALGMILAVPILMIFKTVADHVESMGSISELLGDRAAR